MKLSLHSDLVMKVLGNRLVLHVLFWAVLLSASVLLEPTDTSKWRSLFNTSIYLSFLAAAVYAHFFIFTLFLHKKKIVLYLVCLFLILVGIGTLENSLSVRMHGSQDNLPGEIFSVMFFIGFTTAIKYARAGVRQRLQLQEITAKQLQTELALLKAQINPHFLFNTLNNLYAMALREENPATANGIAKLSHLMRYVIYDSNIDRIELSREVEQIRSFIELQKLRFWEEDPIEIRFEISGDVEQYAIAPMLLLPFVENAFKHGISPNRPSQVSIQLSVEPRELRFCVENTLHRSQEAPTNGASALGLRNVNRRLELLYPESHRLSIDQGDDKYRLVLELRT